jgi:hypothetical protein
MRTAAGIENKELEISMPVRLSEIIRREIPQGQYSELMTMFRYSADGYRLHDTNLLHYFFRSVQAASPV